MSPLQRRADAFAAVVDGRSGDARSAVPAEILEVVGALRALPAAQPRPEFSATLRERLMAAADTALVPTSQRPVHASPKRRRDRRIAVTAGAAALLGCTTSVAFAAQTALPGDTLYPIKRILESAEASLASDDAARAEQYLDLAASRLDEAQQLAASRDADSMAELPGTLEAFVQQATTASDGLLDAYADSGDREQITQLRDFISASLDKLAELKSAVPGDYAGDFDDAVNALLSLDEQALSACPECGGLLDVPAILLSVSPIAEQPRIAPAPRQAEAPVTEPKTTDPVEHLLADLPVEDPTGSSPTTPPKTSETKDPVTALTDTVTGTLDPVLESTLGQVTEPLAQLLQPLLGSGDGTGLLN